MRIVPLTEDLFSQFVLLVNALADYEKLEPPTPDAVNRLQADAFGENRRYQALLAIDEGGSAVGYAIWFETYSSFLALPTMYLEDLFVLPDQRKHGAGGMLFDYVVDLAKTRGCGRVDWQVLDWNNLAREFYAKRRAEFLTEWLLYRITL